MKTSNNLQSRMLKSSDLVRKPVTIYLLHLQRSTINFTSKFRHYIVQGFTNKGTSICIFCFKLDIDSYIEDKDQ